MDTGERWGRDEIHTFPMNVRNIDSAVQYQTKTEKICLRSIIQEEGDKKEGEGEEKEQEKLGKLEFSLDYNFTDAQVVPSPFVV